MSSSFPSESLVSWSVDDLAVNGTLTRPDAGGPWPAVIMVAGSGPTDRDWNSPLLPGTNGSAALLAQALTAAGYVTLRYDKRASGPQGRENAMRMAGKISMQGHLDELAGGVRLLAGREDVDAGRIYGLGNSEGCIHVLNYQCGAVEPPLAGLILTAPPARPVGEVARGQIAAQVQGMPDGTAWMAAYDAAMADFAAGRAVTAVDPALPEGMRNLILAAASPINQPFARELWVLDPAELLAQVQVPVLVIIGKKDVQVGWQTDGGIVAALAASRQGMTVVFPEYANHVLKYEDRDVTQLSPADIAAGYNAADRVLDADSLKVIVDWLADHR